MSTLLPDPQVDSQGSPSTCIAMVHAVKVRDGSLPCSLDSQLAGISIPRAPDPQGSRSPGSPIPRAPDPSGEASHYKVVLF